MKSMICLIAALLTVLSVSAPRAEIACDLRARTIAELEKAFKEKVSGRGVTANGYRMVELFVSETGSWTILATDTKGRSCLLAEGESWHGISVPAGEAI
ncbi:MAG: hypothetical protein R3229_11990 [Alphaproteobacteria bacterium]|nr:hypothetical protein [Alphaproteobacteria bacterium]